MKRSLILLLISIICIISCILPLAADSTDSLHLSSEEESLLDTSSNELVVKLFSGSFMGDFADREDITSIAAKSRIVYLIANNYGGVVYKKNYNGEMVKIDPSSLVYDWSEFYTYAVYPNSVFDSTVKINEIYCLNGASSHDGVYIYYDTDHGKYVLFKEFLSDDETYLFPISDFYDFAEKVYNNRILHKDYDGVSIPDDLLLEVEDYLLKPKSNFNWIAPVLIVIFVLVSVGVVLCLLLRRRVKKNK